MEIRDVPFARLAHAVLAAQFTQAQQQFLHWKLD